MARLSKTSGKTTKAKARKASPAKSRKVVKDPETRRRVAREPHKGRSVAELEAQLELRTKEAEEWRQRQAATADILKVIASSPNDVQPVFDAIVTSAAKLFEPCGATITTLHDNKLHWDATAATLPVFDAERAKAIYPIPFDPDRSPSARAMLERRIIEIPDTSAPETPELTRKAATAGGFRSITFVPLITQDKGIGTIILTHLRPGFELSKDQLVLVKAFADQAVIAIENARSFKQVQDRTNDLKESLQQQTATADVLKVISRSAFDLDTVLNSLIRTATSLCDTEHGQIFRREGDIYRYAASVMDLSPDYLEIEKRVEIRAGRGTLVGRVAQEKRTIQIIDALEDPDYAEKESAKIGGVRTMLGVPMLRDGELIGTFAIARTEVRRFTQRQIDLVTTFADQAVIAIENARLFNETKTALERQTATADILKVISRSAFDLDVVMNTLTQSAADLCKSDFSALYLLQGETLVARGLAHTDSAQAEFLRRTPLQSGSATYVGRTLLAGAVRNIADYTTETEIGFLNKFGQILGFRAILFVPLMREGRGIGVFALARRTIGNFSTRDVDLVQTFADQAVIAIENVRLFDELQAKTSDLAETLQQQTATADVLKVISRSAFDLQTVLETLIKSAVELCGANRGSIFLREGDFFPLKAASHTTPEFLQYWAANPPQAGRGSATHRVIASGKIEIIPDVLDDPEMEMPPGALARIRGTLGVPMLRDNKVEGVIVLTRPEPGPFTKSQIDLVQTFADQAVIAVENVRLFEETQARTRELAASLEELRAAQDRLVQTEKLASLGQLTAGIAHEIKNPLNFVNNFAALSAELTGELNDLLKPEPLAGNTRREVDELTALLKDNLDKIVQHGRRADSIVKNMLLHSRDGSGEHRSADINSLVEESLNLAYHGARAEIQNFNISLHRDLDPHAGSIEVFPQEITRALLNLISNGFYAATQRKSEEDNPTFEPLLSATTKDLGDNVEVRIRDNGTGIPVEVKEKMFNPFFTTKPAGKGTGLGLSMTYDIVVKQHGGKIDVVTEPGAFTEFVITLPRNSSKTASCGGHR